MILNRAFVRFALCALLLAACERAPAPAVGWGRMTRVQNVPRGQWVLALDQAGHPTLAQAEGAPLVLPRGACASSAVFARMGRREWYAAWWQPRADSSAALVVARSTNGAATWSPPVTADARDRATLGCHRPRPAIAADPTSGTVYVAYFLRATGGGGAGVWLTRSAAQGTRWHAPAYVALGNDPAAVSIAAHGDTVAVAYEDPSARGARVSIAASTTAGGSFDFRRTVSGTNETASDPHVALRGSTLAVAWQSRPRGGRGSAPELLITVGALQGR
jgi:hypothetical protein